MEPRAALHQHRYLLRLPRRRGATAAIELEQEAALSVQIVHVGQPHTHDALAQARHLGAYVEVVELLLGHGGDEPMSARARCVGVVVASLLYLCACRRATKCG